MTATTFIVPLAFVRRLVNKAWVIFFLLSNCTNGQNDYHISQCYVARDICTVIRVDAFNAERKELFVYQGKRLSTPVRLDKPPCKINSIRNDTIFISYFVFVQFPNRRPKLRISNIPLESSKQSEAILVEEFVEVNGTGMGGYLNPDSIKIHDNYFITYGPGMQKDTFDVNHIIFGAEGDFNLNSVTISYADRMPMVENIRIIPKDKKQAEKIFYDNVEASTYGHLSEILEERILM